MLPTSTPTDKDDKHAKYRRVVCCKGSRWFAATLFRSLLLFAIPLLFLVFRMLSGQSESSSISASTALCWLGVSVIGWLIERCRVRLIRRKKVTNIPFLSLVGGIYLVQIVLFFMMASPAVNWEETAQRRMRGQLVVVNASREFESEELPPWNEIVKRVALDDRMLERMSAVDIVKAHDRYHATGVLSIVLACHNEHEYMNRTLDSILNSTAPGILKEILIVDDGSNPPISESFDTDLFKEPLVKIIRNEAREGLIRSKNLGGNISTGSVIVFLDAHVKPDPGWAFPIIRHINQNYRRVVVPKIPVLNGTTWEVNRKAVGEKMMFEWDLAFHWFDNDDDWVPCMSGGLLAISRKWWTESGELDTGMFVWGGENIEQSVRIWLCGGEIVVAHDSVIAHVFRPRFPYSVDSTKVLWNKLRTVEVWFDEFKELYYNSTGHSAIIHKPRSPIPMNGQGSYVSPEIDESGPFVNISKRLELREKLHCKPFKWYVEKFEDVFRDRHMLATETFLIRHPSSNQCMKSLHDTPGGELGFFPCDEQDAGQRWTSRYNNTSIQSIRQGTCLDATIGKMPEEWRFAHASYTYKGATPLMHFFETFTCQKANVNQSGWKLLGNRLSFGSFCMQIQPSATPQILGVAAPKAFLSSCSSELTSSQHFEAFATKVLQPTALRAMRLIH